jgi:polyhydroxybutyrate depolymerase
MAWLSGGVYNRRMRRLPALVMLLTASMLGCTVVAASTAADAGAPVQHPAKRTVFGGSRPVTLQVPVKYDNGKPTPLIILLHGYGASGFEQTAYFGYDSLVDEAGVLFAAPDGTLNSQGNRFWNATDFCCDFEHKGIDDVGYITGLIADISAEYNVDPRRVYLNGHSNGGFMSYRMACEKPELIAAIVSLAGAMWIDPSKCSPTQDVSVLHIHGTADAVISYSGAGPANGLPAYPGALVDVDDWRIKDHCAGLLQPATMGFDIGTSTVSSKVQPQQVAGCPAGIDVNLWTIPGGSHIPALGENFRAQTWAWMQAHPKP